MSTIHRSKPLRSLSPLKPSGPRAKESTPRDELVMGPSPGENPSRFLRAAFTALAVLGAAGAAQAAAPSAQQIQLRSQVPVQSESLGLIMAEPLTQDGMIMVRLHQQAQARDMKLEYFFQRDGERLAMNEVQAARALTDGVLVEFQEVSRLPGGQEIRASGYLESRDDLQSFARYFTGAAPQNLREQAAQKLYGKLDEAGKPAFLLSAGGNPRRDNLSAFEAAKKLEANQAVSLVVPVPESMTEFSQFTYSTLQQVLGEAG